MADIDYLAHIRANGAALGEYAARDLSAAIPTCPGFSDQTQLLEHLGMVFSFVIAQLEAMNPSGPSRPGDEAARGDRDPSEYYAERLAVVLAALESADLDAAAWNWSERDDAGFYARRMAHEVAVHCLDAAAGAGETHDLDRDLAVDGIDELLDVGMNFSTSKPDREYPGGTLHLHCTDGDGEWLITSDGDRVTYTHEHAKGDVAVRGSAQELLTYLWGRGRKDLEVFGDEALADAWAAVSP